MYPKSVDSAPKAQATPLITDPEVVRSLSPMRLVVAMCLLTVCATSCSTGPPESIAFADDAVAIEQPDLGELDTADRELVTFHAQWICELQRRTFDSLEDADVARDTALEAAAIARARYEDFLRVSLRDQLVRDAVLYEYQEVCRAE